MITPIILISNTVELIREVSGASESDRLSGRSTTELYYSEPKITRNRRLFNSARITDSLDHRPCRLKIIASHFFDKYCKCGDIVIVLLPEDSPSGTTEDGVVPVRSCR